MRKLYFISLAILFFLSFSVLYGQSTEEFFERNCFSCHTIGGGRLTGPDLKNVDQRKDEAWLEKFILNPEVILRGGDPYAAKLLKEARGVRMTRVAGLNAGLAKNLLKFIKEESAKEKTRFAKSALKERPLTPEDIVLGRQFFLGTLPLMNKGPACLGCHSIAG
ncbi:MAG: cytochrome c, partial [Candidatus Aminicenantes bacterium]|nr:cytochrome c [Candidatus Aminicenantes bacterium]